MTSRIARAQRRSPGRRPAGRSASAAALSNEAREEGLAPAYRLTIRHGSSVERHAFESLDEAIEAIESRVRAIRLEGPLDEVRALRDYESGERVHARLELSTGGLIRGREAGLDVMGNGDLVPYVGVVRRRRLEAADGKSAFDAVREALAR